MTSTAPTKIPTHTAEAIVNRVLAIVRDSRTEGANIEYDVLAQIEAAVLATGLAGAEKIEIQGSPKSLMDQADTFRLGLEASLAFAPANATDSERNTISIMMTEAAADLRRTAVDALEMLDYLWMGRLYFRADALGRFNAALNNLTAVHTLTRALKERQS